MFFKIFALVFQLTIISLLIEGSIQQSDDRSHANDGCNIYDKKSYIGDGFIGHYGSIESVTDCEYQCDVDSRCEYWVLHKDNKYCDLFRGNVTLREDENCIAGSRGCSDYVRTSDICKSLEPSYKSQCLNRNNTSDQEVDEEHCESLLEFLVENCNLNISVSKNLSEPNIIVKSATTPFTADSPPITTTTATTTIPTTTTTTNPTTTTITNPTTATTTNPTDATTSNPTTATSMPSFLCYQILSSFTGFCFDYIRDEYQCKDLSWFLAEYCNTYEDIMNYVDYYEYQDYPEPYISY